MSYAFGPKSAMKVATCHRDMQLILNESIAVSPVDFGISEGRRTFEDQLHYFQAGKSKLDPRIPEQAKKAKHLPNDDGVSMAADFYAYVPGKANLAYDYNHLCIIAGVIISTGNRLLREGKVTHAIRWGGNWDGDGEIIVDQTFNDLPHVELISV